MLPRVIRFLTICFLLVSVADPCPESPGATVKDKQAPTDGERAKCDSSLDTSSDDCIMKSPSVDLQTKDDTEKRCKYTDYVKSGELHLLFARNLVFRKFRGLF